jgi:hypothetical protein
MRKGRGNGGTYILGLLCDAMSVLIFFKKPLLITFASERGGVTS